MIPRAECVSLPGDRAQPEVPRRAQDTHLQARLAATGASEPRWHRMRRRLPDVLRPRADMLYRPEVGACLGELLAGLCPERSNSEEAR